MGKPIQVRRPKTLSVRRPKVLAVRKPKILTLMELRLKARKMLAAKPEEIQKVRKKRPIITKPRKTPSPKISSSMDLVKERQRLKGASVIGPSTGRLPIGQSMFTDNIKTWADKTIKKHEIRVPTTGFYRPLIKEYPMRVTRGVRQQKGRFTSYPSPLGIELLIEVTLSLAGYRFFSEPANYRYLSKIIWELRLLQMQIESKGRELIDRFVPKDTGDLRASLKESLSQGKSDMPDYGGNAWSAVLRMRFFSELTYGGIVARMKTASIRHPQTGPNARNRSWRTGEMLDDPEATQGFKGFFIYTKDKIQQFTKQIFIKNFLDNISRYMGLPPKMIRGWFKVKGLGGGV